MRGGVEIVIELDNIYAYSVIRLRATSETPFTLLLGPGYFFEVERGLPDTAATCRSMQDEEHFVVEAKVAGIFAQVPVSDGVLRPGKAPGWSRVEYGVRFYPFISSVLVFGIRSSVDIRGVVFDNSADVRIGWDQATHTAGRGEHVVASPQRLRAHAVSGWRQAFKYQPSDKPTHVEITVPIAASGRFLTRRLTYPLVAWFGSLVAIFGAWELVNDQAAIAALGGSLTLLLREWVQSERAHQMNLGTFVLAVEGAALVLIAACLLLFPSAVAGALVAVAGSAGVLLARQAVTFEYSGRLPPSAAHIWAAAALRLELRRAYRRRRHGAADFDHRDRHL